MDIDLLYVPDCPNRTTARELVELALARTHRTAVVCEREIDSLEEAERLGMRGSPSILIDGRDPFADGAGPAAVPAAPPRRGGAGSVAGGSSPRRVQEEHLPGALHLPLKQLDADAAGRILDRGRPVVVYCWDGL